jgi:hypothetical protein
VAIATERIATERIDRPGSRIYTRWQSGTSMKIQAGVTGPRIAAGGQEWISRVFRLIAMELPRLFAITFILICMGLPVCGQSPACASTVSEAKIIELLVAKASDDIIQSVVTRCGVDFSLDDSSRARLKAAGASPALIALLPLLSATPKALPPAASSSSDHADAGAKSTASATRRAGFESYTPPSSLPRARREPIILNLKTNNGANVSTSREGILSQSKNNRDQWSVRIQDITGITRLNAYSIEVETRDPGSAKGVTSRTVDFKLFDDGDRFFDAVDSLMDSAGAFDGVALAEFRAEHFKNLRVHCTGTLFLTAATIRFVSPKAEDSFDWSVQSTEIKADTGAVNSLRLKSRAEGRSMTLSPASDGVDQDKRPISWSQTVLRSVFGRTPHFMGEGGQALSTWKPGGK